MLDNTAAIGYATDLSVSDPGAEGDSSIVLLGTETADTRLSRTVDGTAVSVVRASVAAGEDGVTAIAVVPSGKTVPPLFEAVRRGE